MLNMLKRIRWVSLAVLFLYASLYASAYADSPRIQNSNNGHWYQRFDETMTWHNAKSHCESLGGHLATITSQQENDFVYNNLASTSPHISWLGATDEAQEGIWKWVTGEGWNYTNWYPDEPNNFCGEHYLHFTAGNNFWELPTNGWNDLQTGNNGGIICGERSGPWFATSTICEWGGAPEDSDGDGIADNRDECSSSDLSATAVIDGCDSGVPNTVFPSGCTISDLIAPCAVGASNHGQFVSCVSHVSNDLKNARTITGQQKGAIQSCAAQADIP